MGTLVKTACEEAIEEVSNPGYYKNGQSQSKALVEHQGNKDGDENHPEDGKDVGKRNNAGGHESA